MGQRSPQDRSQHFLTTRVPIWNPGAGECLFYVGARHKLGEAFREGIDLPSGKIKVREWLKETAKGLREEAVCFFREATEEGDLALWNTIGIEAEQCAQGEQRSEGASEIPPLLLQRGGGGGGGH